MGKSNVFFLAFLASFSLLSIANVAEAKVVEKSTFTVPIRSSMTYQEIRQEAEQQTNAYISSTFSQNPDLESLRLEVLGKKAVEIVPIFSVFISRTQWQESPHIHDWVSYNQASFSLLQGNRPLIARVEEKPVASSTSRAAPNDPVERPVINQFTINNLDKTEIDQLIDQGTDPQRLINMGVNPQIVVDELD